MLPQAEALDVNDPEDVEIVISLDGKTIWLNAEGKCAVRCFQVRSLTISDRRKPPLKIA